MASFALTAASVVLYALAGALGAYATLHKADHSIPRAKSFFALALACHTLAIGITSIGTSGTIISGPNILMLAAWILAIATLALATYRSRAHAYLAFAGPAVAVLITLSHIFSVALGTSPTNQVYHEWPLLVAHILLVFISVAAFAVSAFSSIMQLHQSALMKSKSKQLLHTNMPAMSALSSLARRAVLLGIVLFSITILIGFSHLAALYAAMSMAGCQGEILYLAPRMVLSVLVWLLYVSYLVMAYLLPHLFSSRFRASLSVFGFALTIVLVAVSAG